MGHRVVRLYPSGSACHVGRRCQPWLPDRHEAKAGDKVRNAMELGTHKPEVRDAELRLAKRLVDELDVLRMNWATSPGHPVLLGITPSRRA
jgi:hypothetical protein